jgi:hypothetical protein
VKPPSAMLGHAKDPVRIEGSRYPMAHETNRTVAWWLSEPTAVGHCTIATVFAYLNISEANEIPGSQTGSIADSL